MRALHALGGNVRQELLDHTEGLPHYPDVELVEIAMQFVEDEAVARIQHEGRGSNAG